MLLAFYVINFAYLHASLGQSPRLVEAQSFHSATFNCFLALCAENVVAMQPYQAKGKGQIEEDWVGSRKSITNKI